MSFSPLLEQLINHLRCLPSVGPKSAQRMAFHLLARDRDGGKALAQSLLTAMSDINHCQQCRNFSETAICKLCSNPRRDSTLLCVVESPADVLAIEQTGFQGRYFVLQGHLSPIDGIGPDDIGMDIFRERLAKESIQEIILATNPTVEGNATAHYIAQVAKQFNIASSRIAHGVPIGSELEYIDGGTLAHAFAGREEIL